jgi:hypothetical protein
MGIVTEVQVVSIPKLMDRSLLMSFAQNRFPIDPITRSPPLAILPLSAFHSIP